MAIEIGSGSGKISATINVTPMIDILLVLLIVFMLLPNHTRGLKSDVPEPAPENSKAIPNPQNLVLRIQKDRSMDINSQPVQPADLESRLRLLFAARPDGVLFVQGDSELEYADVALAIDTARGAGVDRIGLLTEKQ